MPSTGWPRNGGFSAKWRSRCETLVQDLALQRTGKVDAKETWNQRAFDVKAAGDDGCFVPLVRRACGTLGDRDCLRSAPFIEQALAVFPNNVSPVPADVPGMRLRSTIVLH